MAYRYDPTPDEEMAAARLRENGWLVEEPKCPLCHGNGTVTEWASAPPMTNTTYTITRISCPNGCPVPVAFYSANIVPPSPREAAELARAILPALKREMARQNVTIAPPQSVTADGTQGMRRGVS